MSRNTIEVYEDAAGEYRWRHRMCEQLIAKSSEGYVNKADCLNGATDYRAVQTTPAVDAQYTVTVYLDAAGELRWRLRHQNGNIVAASPKGYSDGRRFGRVLMAIDGHVADAELVDTTE